jgi:hypothetical protein
MSEGVAEIWINNQPCKGINLTTRHMQAQRAPQVAKQFTTWPKTRAGSYLALVSSSTCMPQRIHRGWPEHCPIIHPWSEVRYHPTHRHMKLLSLGIPYAPYAPVHFKCLFNRAQPTRVLIDISDQTTHPPSHPIFSISPNCPAQFPIMATIRSSC